MSGAAELALGNSNSCARLASGQVECWGEGFSATPSLVRDLTGATSIAAGARHACALLGDRTVQCWGYNGNERLGSPGPDTVRPRAVPSLTNVVQIAVSDANGCALRGDGSVWCWGTDQDFMHPDGVSVPERPPAMPPTKVPALADVVEIHLAKNITSYPCARFRDGSVACVGGTYLSPVIGDTPRLHPVAGLAGVRSIALGEEHQCAVLADRGVSCWGGNPNGQTGQPIAIPRGPIAVTGLTGVRGTLVAGDRQTCLLGGYSGAGDGVYCWGAFHAAPTRIDSKRLDGRPVELALVGEACVRTDRGHVFCFGNSWLDTAPRAELPLRPAFADPVALAKSHHATCALERDGSVECLDSHGVPAAIDGIVDARVIAIDSYGDGCAIKADATVACWKVEHDEYLGEARYSAARPVPALQGASAIALESPRGCALMPGGELECWTGLAPDAQHPAHTLLTKVRQVAASLEYTCALRATGEVLCWGANDSAQLGTGAPSRPHAAPVRVFGP